MLIAACVPLAADYIMKRKMVPIEEAATEFGLRSSEVVDRIQVRTGWPRCCSFFARISASLLERPAQHVQAVGVVRSAHVTVG